MTGAPTSSLRLKPWWLRWFTPRWFWVTLSPWIYYPEGENLLWCGPSIEHEKVHLRQQAELGLRRFLVAYALHRGFRLQAEAEAMGRELAVMEAMGHGSNTISARLQQCVAQLASRTYLWAAKDRQEAERAIMAEWDRQRAA